MWMWRWRWLWMWRSRLRSRSRWGGGWWWWWWWRWWWWWWWWWRRRRRQRMLAAALWREAFAAVFEKSTWTEKETTRHVRHLRHVRMRTGALVQKCRGFVAAAPMRPTEPLAEPQDLVATALSKGRIKGSNVLQYTSYDWICVMNYSDVLCLKWARDNR